MAPHARRHRLLHVAATMAHQADGVAEAEALGGDQRGVFAQAVAGHEIGDKARSPSTAQAATETVSNAGCWFSVSLS